MECTEERRVALTQNGLLVGKTRVLEAKGFLYKEDGSSSEDGLFIWKKRRPYGRCVGSKADRPFVKKEKLIHSYRIRVVPRIDGFFGEKRFASNHNMPSAEKTPRS